MSTTILIKRGLESNRTSITPASGEFLWTTDNNDLWIGDGSTLGGIKVTGNIENTTTLVNYFNKTESDARYVQLAGDTMTGALILNGDPTLALGAVTKQYVDGLIDSGMKTPDGFATDASANYPSDYKSSGTVSSGDTFYITSVASGTAVGTKVVNNGDLLVALVDNPANTDANWAIIESNRDQATETVKGVAKVATQAEVDTGTDDTTFITPAKLANTTNINAEAVEDIVGNMVSTNIETGITVTYDDPNGKLDFAVNTVDNVTSTSTTDPLSANQGRILNDNIIAMAIALG